MKPPYFIIDEKELISSFTGFDEALRLHFKNYIPSYSVKTNSLPYIIKKANEYCYYAEVVSEDELRLALACGFSYNHIIYNGPMKSKESFVEAICNGCLINIDSFREIEWLKDLSQFDNLFHIGIRVNINISKISPDDENHPNDDSRFGFSFESGDFDKAIDIIKALPNVQLKRIHIHRTSRTRSLDFYKNLIDYTMNELKKRGLVVEQIDVGGGFFGIMYGKPTYKEYASTIANTINKYCDLDKTTIIIEPGNAIVASCFDFVSSVIDIKQHDGVYFVTIDGSRIDIDPFFHKGNYFVEYERNSIGTMAHNQILCGCTCLEYDRFMSINDQPLLREGDKIIFKRVGAYTMTLTPLFIRYWPDVYVNNGKSVELVRNKWDSNKLL